MEIPLKAGLDVIIIIIIIIIIMMMNWKQITYFFK